MRSRSEIEVDSKRADLLTLEVLLDIRGLLETPQSKSEVIKREVKAVLSPKKRGRPKKK